MRISCHKKRQSYVFPDVLEAPVHEGKQCRKYWPFNLTHFHLLSCVLVCAGLQEIINIPCETENC